ncbi:MAG: hypothetical protein H6Q45_639 [Deltaproteobacteria bacterium]|nr:hypothetical protein [Deltaproteobacteria bacterium]
MSHAIVLSLIMLLILSEVPPAEDTLAATNQTGTITVRLTGFENDEKEVKMCICRSEDEYTGKVKEYRTASAPILNKKALWVFKDMPYGPYSIKAFHDQNGNNRLDTNFMGMPTERYGFSNHADGRFGLPPFSQTVITLNAPEAVIDINLD